MIEFSFTVQFPGQARPALHAATSVPSTGVTAVFGRSGSGKTTLLRCIAGLQTATGSVLRVSDSDWSQLPTHQRDIGYVFQESSLFDHLTAAGNLDYAAKRSLAKPTIDEMQHITQLLGIDAVLNQYPAELSGGERQRIAIARALIVKPRVLLMDEPLASLDLERKQEILTYLDKVRESLDIPVFYVSHSLDEVTHLADHLLVLEQGNIVAEGPVTEVLSRIDLPIRLGEDTGVVLEGHIVARDEAYHLVRVAFAGGEIWLRDQGDDIGAPMRIRVLARDVSLALSSHADTSIQNRLPATVVDIVTDSDQAMALVRLSMGESFIISRLTRRSLEQLGIQKGQTLWVQIKSMAIVR